MFLEQIPEITEARVTPAKNGRGRHLVEYDVLKITRHYDQLSRSLNEGSDWWRGNRLSAVRFDLYGGDLQEGLLAPPQIWIVGNGVGSPEIYTQGVFKSNQKEATVRAAGYRGTWSIRNWENPGPNGILHLLPKRSDRVVGIPTLAIPPFITGSDLVEEMTRRFNIHFQPGSDLLQVDALMAKNPEDERLKLRFVSDERTNYTIELATLRPNRAGWVITPSGRRHPTKRHRIS